MVNVVYMTKNTAGASRKIGVLKPKRGNKWGNNLDFHIDNVSENHMVALMIQ